VIHSAVVVIPRAGIRTIPSTVADSIAVSVVRIPGVAIGRGAIIPVVIRVVVIGIPVGAGISVVTGVRVVRIIITIIWIPIHIVGLPVPRITPSSTEEPRIPPAAAVVSIAIIPIVSMVSTMVPIVTTAVSMVATVVSRPPP